jgi:hypothetical protein
MSRCAKCLHLVVCSVVSRNVRPIDGPQYEGLLVRVMCSITAKVTAPLHEQPQPKAVVKLQFRMHEIVFLGGERPPVHRTSIESLGRATSGVRCNRT